MRERLKAEAGGAILAWIAQGARLWLATGTEPPESVQSLTADYLCEQDLIGQWLGERCERKADAIERSSDLHRDYPVTDMHAGAREADDRRPCAACRNLSQGGRCLAAWRGERIGNAGRQYSPVPDISRRCEGYTPTAADPDRRTGAQRWPTLVVAARVLH